MKFKKLDLTGFKSFFDKTTIINHNNITTEFNGIKIDQGSYLVSNNFVRANCKSEDCQKISFVKVGNKGLDIINVKNLPRSARNRPKPNARIQFSAHKPPTFQHKLGRYPWGRR